MGQADAPAVSSWGHETVMLNLGFIEEKTAWRSSLSYTWL